jgi:hypothetical protein
MTTHTITSNEGSTQKVFFIMPGKVSWWIWLITACLLAVGLAGFPHGFVAAILLSALQSAVYWIRERRISAFPVQLRVAYTLLLGVCFLPLMSWLFWLPTVGTFALNILGYCLMARCLSLLSWNRHESITLDLLFRTFLSRPMIANPTIISRTTGCAGSVCSIAAQVRPRNTTPIQPDSL